tara:strand:- start:2165 stop:2680 length:516 start_codon:yes stop_codon:yes gene_type:complete
MKIKLTENQFQRIVKEMRFDGKSTGLFSDEEPELKGVYPPDVDGDGDRDGDDAKHCTYSDHCDFDYDGYIDDTGKYIGNHDIDADGIPDYKDDVLAVDRFDIEQRIKSALNEYYSDPYLTTDPENKWDKLEKDVGSCITDIVETHKDNFGHDSYAVIDAIYQVMDGMFQKV